MDTVDRIFELADKKYQEQRFFADDLQVSRTMVSAWRTRKSTSYMKRLPQIAELLGTSAEYLLTGDQPGASSGAVSHPLLEKFDRLSPADQEKATAFIDWLLAQEASS